MKKIVKAIVSYYSWRSPTFFAAWVLTITGIALILVEPLSLRASIKDRSDRVKAQAAPTAEKGIEYIQQAPVRYSVPLVIWLAGGISILGALVSFYMAVRAIRAQNGSMDSCRKAELYHNPPDLEAKVAEARKWAEEAKRHADDAVSYAAVMEPGENDACPTLDKDCQVFCYNAPFVDLPASPGGEVKTTLIIGNDADFVANRMSVVGVCPVSGKPLDANEESYTIAIQDCGMDRTMSNVPIHIQSLVKSPNWTLPFAKSHLFRRSSCIQITVTNKCFKPARVYVSLFGYKGFGDPTGRDISLSFSRDSYYSTNVVSADDDEDYDDEEKDGEEIDGFSPGKHKRYYTADEFMNGDGSEDKNA